LTAEVISGATGIILGMLTILNVAPMVLMPAAANDPEPRGAVVRWPLESPKRRSEQY
jgi:hypothetical protein